MSSQKEKDQLLKLLKTPEVLTLTNMVVFSLVQLLLISLLSSWFQTCLFGLTVGAYITHSLYVLNVEFAMNLCFQDVFLDRVAGIAGNLVCGIPFAEPLRYNQAIHRAFPGQMTDPQQIMGEFTWIKLLLYPLSFFCGMWRNIPTIDHFVLVNVMLQMGFLSAIWYIYGWMHIIAVLLSFYFSFCPLHPIAVHLVLEHPGPKSYYGIWNAFTFNVGYHIERHSQPSVPWSRLPMVRVQTSRMKTFDRRSQSAEVYEYCDLWEILFRSSRRIRH